MTAPGNNGGGNGGGEGGQGPGTGSGQTPPPGGNGGSGTGTPSQGSGSSGSGSGSDDWGDRDAWKGLAEELGLSPSEVKEKLGHARTWEQRAKENRSAKQTAQSLEEQVAQMRQDQADRDVRDHERNVGLAKKSLRAELRALGLDTKDVNEAVGMIDTAILLKDGEVDDDAVEKAAKRLGRMAGRIAPDRDQGSGNGNDQPKAGNMNQWLRDQVHAKRGN